MLILVLIHVDQVENDDPAAVSQSELISNFFDCFEVRLENRVLEVFLSDKTSRVHVDRDEGFRLVDDDVTAGLEPHFALERAREFARNSISIENRNVPLIEVRFLLQARHE